MDTALPAMVTTLVPPTPRHDPFEAQETAVIPASKRPGSSDQVVPSHAKPNDPSEPPPRATHRVGDAQETASKLGGRYTGSGHSRWHREAVPKLPTGLGVERHAEPLHCIAPGPGTAWSKLDPTAKQ